MIIRYRPKYEIASLRDALMGLIPIPTLRKSEIFLYGVIEIKPLRGFFGAMRIVIYFMFTKAAFYAAKIQKKCNIKRKKRLAFTFAFILSLSCAFVVSVLLNIKEDRSACLWPVLCPTVTPVLLMSLY